MNFDLRESEQLLEEAVAGNEDAVRINTLQSEATTSVTAVRRQVRMTILKIVVGRAPTPYTLTKP